MGSAEQESIGCMTQAQYTLFLNRLVELEGIAHDAIDKCEQESHAYWHWVDVRAAISKAIEQCWTRV